MRQSLGEGIWLPCLVEIESIQFPKLIVRNLFAHSDRSITTVYAQTDDKLLLEAVKRLYET